MLVCGFEVLFARRIQIGGRSGDGILDSECYRRHLLWTAVTTSLASIELFVFWIISIAIELLGKHIWTNPEYFR